VETEADSSDKTECSHVDKPSTGMFALSDCSCIVFQDIVSHLPWTVLFTSEFVISCSLFYVCVTKMCILY